MQELWEWTGTDKFGKTRTYQTIGPSTETEAAMLDHLKASFRGLTITTLRRCDPREAKQSTGKVERHAYQFGIWDEAMAELHGKPRLRESIRQQFTEAQCLRTAGIGPRSPYVPIRQRIPSLVRP